MTQREELKLMIDLLPMEEVRDVTIFIFGRASAELRTLFQDIVRVHEANRE